MNGFTATIQSARHPAGWSSLVESHLASEKVKCFERFFVSFGTLLQALFVGLHCDPRHIRDRTDIRGKPLTFYFFLFTAHPHRRKVRTVGVRTKDRNFTISPFLSFSMNSAMHLAIVVATLLVSTTNASLWQDASRMPFLR